MNKPKVLLMFPNTSNEGVAPFAISILSTIAKQCEYDVKYFETSFYQKRTTTSEIERELTGEFMPVESKHFVELKPFELLYDDLNILLNTYRPDILAVSANSIEYDFFCEIIEKVHLEVKKPFIIVGGVHATIAPDEVIENKYVDAICIGQGEGAWQEFLLKFKDGQDLSEIDNLWVKTKDGIKKNPLRPLLTDDRVWEIELDESMFGDEHFMKPFDGKLYKRGRIEMSRGCPYECTYCVNTTIKNIYRGKGKFVARISLANLKKRIINLVERGFEMFQFQDDYFFNHPYEKLREFCEWYGSEIRLPLILQTHPESVTEEKIKLIADMNIMVQISCGVESGSERILKDICNRKTSLEKIKEAYKLMHKDGIRTTAYTMIGFPTETREEVFETINLIIELNPHISTMNVFFPFKGLPLRQFCIERGYLDGSEKTKIYTDESILKNQPMSPHEVKNLRRVYRLYTKLPKEYYPEIELCERNYENHKKLFEELVSLSWNHEFGSHCVL